jgi:hypothetical protein
MTQQNGEVSGEALVPGEGVVASVRTVERHVETEFRDALEETLATVSSWPRYAMVPKAGRFELVTTPAGVRDFYEKSSRLLFETRAARMVTQLASDWYVFYEWVATRFDVEREEEYTLQTAALVPCSPQGLIIGEFVWERTAKGAVSEAVESTAGFPLPVGSLRGTRVHEAYLEALRGGSSRDATDLLDDRCIIAVRNYLSDAGERPLIHVEGRSAAVDYLSEWTEAFKVVDISVLVRTATDWYVFAEELHTVEFSDGALSQFRIAAIYPIADDGTLLGQLAYGTDRQSVDAPQLQRGGPPYWQRAGFRDTLLAS